MGRCFLIQVLSASLQSWLAWACATRVQNVGVAHGILEESSCSFPLQWCVRESSSLGGEMFNFYCSASRTGGKPPKGRSGCGWSNYEISKCPPLLPFGSEIGDVEDSPPSFGASATWSLAGVLGPTWSIGGKQCVMGAISSMLVAKSVSGATFFPFTLAASPL